MIIKITEEDVLDHNLRDIMNKELRRCERILRHGRWQLWERGQELVQTAGGGYKQNMFAN